jgi:GTP-binding protein
MNKQGLEELASVMGGRLNFTLEQANEFDLDSIPEASAHDLNEADEPIEALELDPEFDSEHATEQSTHDLNEAEEPLELLEQDQSELKAADELNQNHRPAD